MEIVIGLGVYFTGCITRLNRLVVNPEIPRATIKVARGNVYPLVFKHAQIHPWNRMAGGR